MSIISNAKAKVRTYRIRRELVSTFEMSTLIEDEVWTATQILAVADLQNALADISSNVDTKIAMIHVLGVYVDYLSEIGADVRNISRILTRSLADTRAANLSEDELKLLNDAKNRLIDYLGEAKAA